MKQKRRKQSDFQTLRLATRRMNLFIRASDSVSPKQLADLAAVELEGVESDLRGTEKSAVRKLLLRFKGELKRIASREAQNA